MSAPTPPSPGCADSRFRWLLAALVSVRALETAAQSTGSERTTAALAGAGDGPSTTLFVACAFVAAVLLVAALLWNRRLARRIEDQIRASDESGARLRLAERLVQVAHRVARFGFTSAVDGVLQSVGEALEADRCYASLLSDDERSFDIAHEWCSERTDPIAHAGKGLPLAELPEGELAALDGRTPSRPTCPCPSMRERVRRVIHYPHARFNPV